MPRLKLTRLLIIIITITCFTILAVNLWTELSSPSSLSWQSLFQFEMGTNDNRIINDRHSPDRKRSKVDFNLFGGERVWFMINGTRRPSKSDHSSLAIWPEESSDDRIVNQLMYIPEGYHHHQSDNDNNKNKLKKILLYFGRGGWNDLPMGRTKFLDDNCPVNACTLTANPEEAPFADAIFFKDRFHWPKHRRSMDQVWILFLLECPLHTQMFRNLGPFVFNWTATYRHDSDLVAPYEKFVSYGNSHHKSSFSNKQMNYAHGKNKKVAWFVSNCGARNKRLEYARELSKYIDVDIFGSCGNRRCPRSKNRQCFEMLNHEYKFYLAFENSNCRDYITEKFWVNGLGHNSQNINLIPIVMGAHPDDYVRSSPPNSYIHVDDFASPKSLASYLHYLDKNDTHYNSYFQWKGSGEFINTYFWCRVCAMLHAPPKPSKAYADISRWWSPPGVCLPGPGHWSRVNNNNNNNIHDKIVQKHNEIVN